MSTYKLLAEDASIKLVSTDTYVSFLSDFLHKEYYTRGSVPL